MPNPQPIETKNLNTYNDGRLEWSAVLDVLAEQPNLGMDYPAFLGTVSAAGRPHLVGIGPTWYAGAMYFTSNLDALKSRHLAANPGCSIAAHLKGMDLVLEGTAAIVRDPAVLDAVAAQYRAGGWPAEVADGALTAPYSAQSAGPPPWHLYRLDCEVAHAVGTEEPFGATRWQFD